MMGSGFVNFVRATLRILRQGASLAVLFLAVRFAWLAGADVLTRAKDDLPEALAQGKGSEASPNKGSDPNKQEAVVSGAMEAVQKEDNAHRPDLERLKALAGSTAKRDEIPKAPMPGIKPRRLLVDVGPERSEVFVRGLKVGHTPYLGEISCALDESVKVDILPPAGAPIARLLTCRGDTILVRD